MPFNIFRFYLAMNNAAMISLSRCDTVSQLWSENPDSGTGKSGKTLHESSTTYRGGGRMVSGASLRHPVNRSDAHSQARCDLAPGSALGA